MHVYILTVITIATFDPTWLISVSLKGVITGSSTNSITNCDIRCRLSRPGTLAATKLCVNCSVPFITPSNKLGIAGNV